ncbi:MAG: hypothetical protein FWE70_04885 [Oscillospiraceae bacterium]|nr:hypothetical protein [Oscillospiraceae bacterium]
MPDGGGVSPRDRVLRALRHEDQDFLPFTVPMNKGAFDKAAEFYGDPDFMGKVSRFIAATGVACRLPDARITKEGFGSRELFHKDSPERYAHLAGFAEANKGMFTIVSGPSYFETLWGMYGMENLMADMASDEAFVFRMMDRIHEYFMATIKGIVGHGVDCVHVNDDYGMQQGLIMGVKYWRKYFKPYLKEAVAAIKAGGKYAQLHSCGDLTEIMPDIVDMGFDILNPFQVEAMDAAAMKREYGRHITFSGGVSEQVVIAQGTPDEVEAEIMHRIGQLGAGGGYILGPSQNVTDDVPAENIDRMIKVFERQ